MAQTTDAHVEVAGTRVGVLEGLAEGLHRLRTDDNLRRAVIAAGHAGLPRFSPTAVAESLLQAYESEL